MIEIDVKEQTKKKKLHSKVYNT